MIEAAGTITEKSEIFLLDGIFHAYIMVNPPLRSLFANNPGGDVFLPPRNLSFDTNFHLFFFFGISSASCSFTQF